MIHHPGVAGTLALVVGAGSLALVTLGNPFARAVPTSDRADLLQTSPAQKSDRLPSVATLDTQFDVIDRNSSAAAPLVSDATADASALDDLIVTSSLGTGRPELRPGAEPEVRADPDTTSDTDAQDADDEVDDARNTALPQPLPKPHHDVNFPLPKTRPPLEADTRHTPPVRSPAAATNAAFAHLGAIQIRQPQRPPVVLAAYAPTTETPMPTPRARPSTQPINTPPGTIVTPTPFGIPYVLQTESVETACLKPELVNILRTVEAHYGQKVVITSGYRNRGRAGSLHRSCAAADVIVPGISSQALAAYARTIPSVGGVGTYCHQSMIHIDIGTPRDWKYGCGSYFAMRDGSNTRWGKVQQED